MGRRRKRTLYRRHCTKPMDSWEEAWHKLRRLEAWGAINLHVYPCRGHKERCYHVGHLKGSLTKR